MSNESSGPAPVTVEELSVQGNFSTAGDEAKAAIPATEAEKVVEAPKVDDRFAAKFAALSRQEKQIKQRQMELQQRESAFLAREKQLQEQLASKESELGQFKGFKDKLKSNPLQTLQEEGYDFESLTKVQLNEQNPTPEMLVQRLQEQMDDKYSKQLEDLKAQIEERDKKNQENQVAQATTAYKQSIAAEITTNPDKYELIANTPYGSKDTSEDLVFEVVEEFFNKNQKVLSVQEAADMVENHLINEEQKRREKLKKLKTASTPAAPAPKAAAKQTAPTLSNSLAAESPKNGPKPMSREESLRNAAKLIRWED